MRPSAISLPCSHLDLASACRLHRPFISVQHVLVGVVRVTLMRPDPARVTVQKPFIPKTKPCSAVVKKPLIPKARVFPPSFKSLTTWNSLPVGVSVAQVTTALPILPKTASCVQVRLRLLPLTSERNPPKL